MTTPIAVPPETAPDTRSGLAAPPRFDPYAAAPGPSADRYLVRLNPLVKFAGPLPAMILLVFVRDLATPLALIVLSYALILTGARLTARVAAVILLVVPAFLVVLTAGFALWTDPGKVAHDVVLLQVGDWRLYGGALEIGAATALRLGAILALALIGGLTTTGADLARSLVQQLRVPYRVGYTALAAFRFVPRFGRELEIIRAAHRVRGAAHGRGPISAIRRRVGYVIPLLAGAIRHAERVALAMDARAFGAYPDRTERYLVPFRARDVVFLVLFWTASTAVFWFFFPWGL